MSFWGVELEMMSFPSVGLSYTNFREAAKLRQQELLISSPMTTCKIRNCVLTPAQSGAVTRASHLLYLPMQTSLPLFNNLAISWPIFSRYNSLSLVILKSLLLETLFILYLAM